MDIRLQTALRAILALLSAIVLGAGGLFVGFLLTLVASVALVVVGVDSPAVTIVVSLVFVQGVGCAGVALSYLAFRSVATPHIRDLFDLTDVTSRFRIDAAMPDLRGWATVGAGYVLALGSAIGGSAIVSQFQVDTGTNSAVEIGMESPEVLLLLIPASFLIIGPGEELLFRGVVQGRIREVLGSVTAILVASVVFAMLHWFALSGGSPTGNLVAAGLLIGPAVVLGASYEYTDNIVVPSLIHGLYNATLFTLLYVVIAYSDVLEEAAPQALLVLA